MASANRYKLTLSTKKEVIVSDITINMKNQAVEAAAQKSSSGGGRGFDALLQDELLRLSIYKVNGKVPSGAEREDLDSLLSFGEYSEAMAGMTEALGLNVAKKPKIEVLTGES